MTRGSVRPWVSSVVPATTNAMSTTSGRNGVSSGSDCAAATVITPRIPDQTSTTPPAEALGHEEVDVAHRAGHVQREVLHSPRGEPLAHLRVGDPAVYLLQFRPGGGGPVGVTPQPRDERDDEHRPERQGERGRGQPDPHRLAGAEPGRGVLVEQGLELQPHEQENPAFQQERHRLPVHCLGQPVPGRQQAWAQVAGDEPGHHHGQDPRGTQFLGRDPGEEGNGERRGRAQHRVLQQGPDPDARVPHHQADGDGHDDGVHEVQADLPQVHGAATAMRWDTAATVTMATTAATAMMVSSM